MSKYYKTKSTKRFNFEVSMNDTAKKAGSNTITIATRPESGTGGYNSGGTSLTMTVREALALKTFLDANIYSHESFDSDSSTNISDIEV